MATSGSSILANWTLADVNFTQHCAESARLGTSWTGAQVPFEEFIRVLRFIAPDPFSNVSPGTIVDWIDGHRRENISMALRSIRDSCELEYCHGFMWEGNEDLAGIGIFISYVVEVAFATAFVLILGSSYGLGRRPYGQPINDSKSRLWAAIQTSLGLFWDTTLLFGLAVTTAALVLAHTSHTAYDRVFATLSSSLSVSVVFLTWPLYLPTCRHRAARWIMLCMLCAVHSSLLIGWLWAGNLSNLYDEGTPFEIFCFFWPISEGNTYAVAEMAYFIGSILLVGFSFLLVAVHLGRRVFFWVKKRRAPRSVSKSPVSRVLLVLWCLVMFALMYSTLISLALFRQTASRKAGPSLRENNWGFSQVMALATWLPTALDFILVFKGHLEAIRYRLPLGVDVQLLSRTEMLLNRSGTGLSTGVISDVGEGKNGSQYSLASPGMTTVERFLPKGKSRESLA